MAVPLSAKTLALASEDKTIKLWDMQAGQERASIEGHTNNISCVANLPVIKTLPPARADKIKKLCCVKKHKETRDKGLAHSDMEKIEKLLVHGDKAAATRILIDRLVALNRSELCLS